MYGGDVGVGPVEGVLLPREEGVEGAGGDVPAPGLAQVDEAVHEGHGALAGDEGVRRPRLDLFGRHGGQPEVFTRRAAELAEYLAEGEFLVRVGDGAGVEAVRVEQGFRGPGSYGEGVYEGDDDVLRGRQGRGPGPAWGGQAGVHADEGLGVVGHEVSGAEDGPGGEVGGLHRLLDVPLRLEDALHQAAFVVEGLAGGGEDVGDAVDAQTRGVDDVRGALLPRQGENEFCLAEVRPRVGEVGHEV